jgi:hypothetical protein
VSDSPELQCGMSCLQFIVSFSVQTTDLFESLLVLASCIYAAVSVFRVCQSRTLIVVHGRRHNKAACLCANSLQTTYDTGSTTASRPHGPWTNEHSRLGRHMLPTACYPTTSPFCPHHSSTSPFPGIFARTILSQFSRQSGSNAFFSWRMASTVSVPSSWGR